MEEIRQVQILWVGREVEFYDAAEKKSVHNGVGLQEYVKKLIEKDTRN
jgi:hypothetical protein